MASSRTKQPKLSANFTSAAEQEEVLVASEPGLRVVTLNRPKALNALNLSMVRQMYPLYRAWMDYDAVRMIIQEGSGPKAFCAGGDVASLYHAHNEGGEAARLTADFFREEYQLNHLIATYPKPIVSFLDGITMGGGVGLSVHAPFRVATEKTMFAMPETALGLFPDVGGSHFLSRLPGHLGMYLALSGARLKAADLLYTRVATHYVPSELLGDLKDRLSQLEAPPDKMHESVGYALDEMNVPITEAPLMEHRKLIDECFSKDTVDEITSALQNHAGESEFAAKLVETLNKCSPTSMKITLRQIREGAVLDIGECLKMEYRMSQACCGTHPDPCPAGKDFYEGVRSILIDKDHSPKWNPASLAEVSNELVEAHFAVLPPERELTFPHAT
jgi:enoyl-CoA hydratase/carnithine racemase